MSSIRAEVIPRKEIFRDDETGFKIYSMDIKKSEVEMETSAYGNISVKGDNLPDFNIGGTYDLELLHNATDRYQGSYTMVKNHYVEPQTAEDQWKFLSMVVTELQFKAISEAYAPSDKIIDIINSGTFDHTRVSGYGETSKKLLEEKIKSNMAISEALAYFSEYDVPYNTIKRLVDKYGSAEKTIEVVERNPYAIVEKDGFGFIKADELAMKLGIDEKSPERIKSAMIYVLEDINTNGDIWITRRKLYNKMKGLLGVRKNYIDDIIDAEHEEVFVHQDRYATTYSAYNEWRLAMTMANKVEHEEPLLRKVDYRPEKSVEAFEESQGIQLSDEQKGIFEVIHDTNIAFLIGNAGTGKALLNGSKVQTPNGPINIENLSIGDEVFGVDGSISRVDGVFPQGQKRVYEVEFSDGTVIECSDDHLWTYQTSSMRNSSGRWKTNSLRFIMENEKIKAKSGKYMRNNLYIPMNRPVKYKKKKLPMNPYLLGALLGDGGLSQISKFRFSNSENDVLARVNAGLHDIGHELKKISGTNGYRIVIIDKKTREKSNFRKILEDLGLDGSLSKDKFIPDMYKRSSVEDRLEVLKGLIDTDGYVCGSSAYEYTTSSEQLALDVKEIVESLGMTATHSIKEEPKYEYNGETKIGSKSHRLYIKTSELIPKIHSSKKHEDRFKVGQSWARRTIRDIRETDRYGEMTCISVSSSDKLFLTDNFVSTHNTTAMKGIVDVAEQLDLSTALLAPTGRASKVLTNSTGKQAYTIHKKLGYGMPIEMRKDITIDEDIIIVDESSMIDVGLAKDLMKAIKENSLVIFVGDDAQLPSVGEGNFLFDAINSAKLPVVKLKKVFRQKESGMLDAITRTRQGKAFLSTATVNTQTRGKNFQFRHMIKEHIPYNILQSYRKMLDGGYSAEDIAVLTPTNIGEIGTVELNRLIQEEVNPNSGKNLKDEHTFGNKRNQRTIRVGDYVMNTENMYDATVANKAERADVFNGETGTVIAVNINSKEIIVDFEGNHIVYSFSEASKKLSHAWAITTHKSQGSQYRVVLVIVDSSATYQLNANLLYTGMSRAQDFLGVFGQARTFNNALRKFANYDRNSFLGEFLEEAFEIVKSSNTEDFEGLVSASFKSLSKENRG